MINVLGVDPGLTGTGFCVMRSDGKILEIGTLYAEDGPVADRIYAIASELESILTFEEIDLLVLELPEHWVSTTNVKVAAESGALVKLSMITGAILYAVKSSKSFTANSKVLLPEAKKWKGQLPKEVMKNRLIKKYPELKKVGSSHTIDAVGLAEYGVSTYKKTEGK